jgi:D-alanyl-D-alanine carboxypeptidase/D-alanyl-D-alanine-endopeptidase (penicillin-binding protein 4)
MLEKINQLLPQEQLFHIFPAGGVSGTIKRWYAPEKGQQPYVYAKTGTLSNQHALSGYLVTKSGKMLIFSFMHNNFTGSINTIRQEMQDIFVFIRDNF